MQESSTTQARLSPSSPFDADEIHPGDPGWDIFEKVIEHGSVMGVWNDEKGEYDTFNADGKKV